MIYFLQRKNGDIKIGTTRVYTSRRAHLTSEHGELELLALIEGSFKVEKALHLLFKDFWTCEGEWFRDVPEIHQYIASQQCLPMPKPVREGQRPYHLHRLAKTQGVSVEDLVTAALEECHSANAAADKLGVSHDTINSFMKTRRWTLEQYVAVITPENAHLEPVWFKIGGERATVLPDCNRQPESKRR